MSLSKPVDKTVAQGKQGDSVTNTALKQLIFKITDNGSIRGVIGSDGVFQTSIIHFLEKACGYKEGSSSARGEWKRIKEIAKDPSATFHAEAAAIVEGL